MRRRQVLALSIAAFAGCTGSGLDAGGSDVTTSPVESSGTTTTSPTSTRTVEQCSTDIRMERPPGKPDDLWSESESVGTRVERAVASQHFDPDGYFHFSLTTEETRETENGVEVTATVDVDFESPGDGENATTVHAHLIYEVTYRLTDRRVVRAAAEQGPTGTVVCW